MVTNSGSDQVDKQQILLQKWKSECRVYIVFVILQIFSVTLNFCAYFLCGYMQEDNTMCSQTDTLWLGWLKKKKTHQEATRGDASKNYSLELKLKLFTMVGYLKPSPTIEALKSADL